jgi:holliday junction DNA helicase RuvB
MPLPPHLEARINAIYVKTNKQPAGPAPKRGEEIFEGTDYPREWDLFVGQEQAKEQLQAAVHSAVARGRRLDHILLASGLHGIGKTTLAMLAAAKAGVGIVQVSGAMSVDEARRVLSGMQDGDVLFWDEIHLAVAGNRNRADWMLPLLTDGVLMTARGAEQMPDITVLGATTDLGKLPQTLISRFMVRPKLVAYTAEEGEDLVFNLGQRMNVWVEPKDRKAVAAAASNNPRDMRMILTAVRDLSYAGTPVDMDKAFEWAGFTRDGLSTVAVDMLLVLLGSPEFTASIDSIHAQLGEPGPLRHHEQALLQRAFITITGRGRQLTDEGRMRAIDAVLERNPE